MPTIAIAGAGYVGTALAVLLAQHNTVHLVDIDQRKIDLLAQGILPIADTNAEIHLVEGKLDLHPTLDASAAYAVADFVIVAVPTNFCPERQSFDTSHVEEVVDLALRANPQATIVIRSTIPIGYTDEIAGRHVGVHLLFSPEFLREGQAIHDNLHPSRIIVGIPNVETHDDVLHAQAERFAQLLAEIAEDDDVPTLFMGACEAESVKLFSNAYLALRVAFFNELDTYALHCGLNTADIIDGVGLDPRIGRHYNKPSFGYGGYCLPKDTKHLLASYANIPQNLIGAIVSSNATRKDVIVDQIAAIQPELVGIYLLAAKQGSNNYRQSSVLGIMERLREHGIPMLVYDPACPETEVVGAMVTNDLELFKERCSLIVCNRYDRKLDDVREKVYSRDPQACKDCKAL